jgi:hypothetical protein
VTCTDDPDQDEKLEPLFMANLSEPRHENRSNSGRGKVHTLPHSGLKETCHVPLNGKGVIIGTNVRVRRKDRDANRDLGVGINVSLHGDIPDSSASGNHLDLIFPQFNQTVHSINSIDIAGHIGLVFASIY